MHTRRDMASNPGKPSPGYFLVRTTGEVVPLIAADELPPNLNLVGVPRSLELEATIGMLNLGLKRSSGSYFELAREDATTISKGTKETLK